jgi:FKBP-type peptidyl-prolyl cis-trans isomerase FkpA
MQLRTSASAMILLAALAAVSVRLAAADEPGPSGSTPVRAFTRVPAPDGIQIRRLNKTGGAKPERNDRVVVHYHGTLKDGSVFDSSVERGRPENFRLDRVVPCWTEALTRLRVGEKAKIVCPADTAYGPKGSPPKIPPDSTLRFEIELLGIQ